VKKNLFAFCLLMFNINNGQTVLLNEDFESYPDFTVTDLGQWGFLDLDQLSTTKTIGGDPAPPVNWVAAWPNAGAKMAYQIFNFSQSNATNDFTGATGDFRNFNARSGQKYAASWAGQMVQSFQGNNDWLITPAVTLGASGNKISMYLKSLSSSYGDERFQIGVYVGSGNPTASSDFTIINTLPYQLVSQNLNIDGNWRNFIYNLDSYSGQTIRVGIHCITQEASALLVDDVKITTDNLVLGMAEGINDNGIITFPNPVNDVLNIKTDKKIHLVEFYTLDGRLLKSIKGNHIKISEFPKGNYFTKIYFADGTSSRKKIIKN